MAYTDWHTLVSDITRHARKTVTESSANKNESITEAGADMSKFFGTKCPACGGMKGKNQVNCTKCFNKMMGSSAANNGKLKEAYDDDEDEGRKIIWKWGDYNKWIMVTYLDSGMTLDQRTEALRKLQSQSPTAYYKISTTKPTKPPTPEAASASQRDAKKDVEDRTWRLSNLIQAIKDNW